MRLLFILLLAGPFLQAQSYTTAKTATGKAQQMFQTARKAEAERDVAGALRAYDKALEADTTFIDAWMFRGDIHRRNEHWSDAEVCYQKAIALDPAYDPVNLYLCALVEAQQGKYSEAAAHAEAFRNTDRVPERMEYELKRFIENAHFAEKAVLHPVPFDPKPLSDAVNSTNDEYLPAFTADGETLIFTRRDGYDENFYTCEKDADGNWKPAKPLEGVNTLQNEGAEAVSPDGSWLIFTACNRRNDGSQGSCDLYWSQQKNEDWTEPRPFSSSINSVDWDAQPSISPDGKTIFFSSTRPGGKGGKDIWFTSRQSGGRWSAPENLRAINTPGDEQTPFLHLDGQTLYFTSDGLPGMGGNDLYLTRLQPDGSWGVPENLGYPINTAKEEGTLTVSLDGRTAYFAASRPDTRGGLDIYSFDLPQAARPQAVTYLKAKITDAVTGYPIQAVATVEDLGGQQQFASVYTKSNGSLLVCLPAGKNYALNVSKKGYLFHSESFQLAETATFDQPFLLKIALQPLSDSSAVAAGKPVENKPIVLQNVFFETGSASLRTESTFELDRLADLLTENPTLNIKINGHTDDVGDEKSNQLLSENRARAVLDYLVKKGIDAARLQSVGYGETRPVADNNTEDGRAKNRRTEFEMVN
ncbi:MAG: PD40 domain-containing protein [Lewinellaceae bacterium]|nr:PD40 domain-containing protein [Lewinellaceae bacterium]